ncbi:MAG: agmatine deiminase family protein [Candidatus Neomarinimicrobiota bacterium]|nr:agmatine deiminase family protein [Candidatus Neomarinimicrobiota bacterium]
MSTHLCSQNLPRNLTGEEQSRLHEIGINRTITDPPDSIVYTPAEFDSVTGVIFAWEAYPTLLTDLIKEVAEDDTAWVVVDNTSEQNSVSNTLSNANVNMDRVVFQVIETNSVWVRDYGPWWIIEPENSLAIIDLVYNRPRPLDDTYPESAAGYFGINYYGLGLIEAGGNMLLDGQGAVIVSNVIFDGSQGFDPTLTQDQLEQYFLDYFGVHKVIVTPHLINDGTGHIDMFVKLINDSTIIVGEYENQSAGYPGNYDICNQVASQLANETNGAGRPFNIVRMPMPPYNNGITYTYINSLIVNNKVLVPIYGISTEFANDDSVLALYETIMPGVEAVGFDCNQIIPANGAIHCIAMKVPALPETIACGNLMGDVNLDGRTNIYDILKLVDLAAGIIEPELCVMESGDLNDDGINNYLDVWELIQLVMGL